ncbi:jg16524 [Pararge aegeria aegeria]|uniref:Jg16524 protein n=1 Tax=Pararge aegeria aegeria TaxID=348720 RepID=A0A8S4SR74_9NEOP|nr:jg16524 [Pararge aegeria aegeria]
MMILPFSLTAPHAVETNSSLIIWMPGSLNLLFAIPDHFYSALANCGKCDVFPQNYNKFFKSQQHIGGSSVAADIHGRAAVIY